MMKNHRLASGPALFLAVSILAIAKAFPAPAPGDDALAQAAAAYRSGKYDSAIELATKVLDADPSSPDAAALRANAHQKRGEQAFREGKIDASLADFDAFLKVYPDRAPHHWQRGISLYYAGRFAEGQKQFETHQTVNPEDVENAVWHFLCVAKVAGLGPGEARKRFIEITRDRRVPMKEIHALFKGAGAEEAVMDAAESESGNRDNALFYAHLYLGLYHEATGDAKASLEHMRKAAVDHAQDHYMGAVAKVHFKLRESQYAKARKDREH